MLTIDALYEADKKHEAAIADLRRQMEERDEIIMRHDQHLERLDECMEEMRATLATKEDIAGLRGDLRERLERDELLDERISMYRQQVDEMRAGHETRFNRRMSWAMVALFIGEIILGWFGMNHGK